MLLLTFRVAQDLYAVDATRVIEVVPRVEPRPIPRTPDFLAGVFGYRGSVVPAIELGRLLDRGIAPGRLSTRVIVVAARRTPASVGDLQPARTSSGADTLLLGLIAEQVHDVVRVEQKTVAFPSLRLESAPYLGPMVQLDSNAQTLAQLIEVDSVLPPAIRDALFGGWEKTDGEGVGDLELVGSRSSRDQGEARLSIGTVGTKMDPRPEADVGVASR